jgi:hypothetical protein
MGRYGLPVNDADVFGTDLYSWPVGRRVSHPLSQIVECGLHRNAKAAIFGGNARRPFGVPDAT